MQFCDECGSMMHTEGDTWVCRSCENEASRDSQAEATMTTQDGQQDDGAPAVADATQDSAETMQEPGGSYEVRLFTCVECGHKWRES